jgi:hypothetical protein
VSKKKGYQSAMLARVSVLGVILGIKADAVQNI